MRGGSGQRSGGWWLRQAARLCFLLGFVCLLSIILLAQCAIHDSSLPPTPDHQGTRTEDAALRDQIRRLKDEILDLRNTIRILSEPVQVNGTVCLRKEVLDGGLSAGKSLAGQVTSEYEVTPYSHFTVHRIYPTELGLGRRVVEKPIGAKRRDLREVVDTALAEANRNRTKRLTEDDLLEGVYRSEPGVGSHYDVYFRETGRGGGYVRVAVTRWSGPAMAISPPAKIHARSTVIHIVMTSPSSLHPFLDKFYRIGLKVDRRVALSVVGARSPPSGRLPSSVRFVNTTTAAINKPWPGVLPGDSTSSDHLLMLCDSHTVFSAKFLERCRWNAALGAGVYYPISFALYNPYIVYTMQGKKIPPENDQLVISRETGFWRDFSYSVSCQYKSDWMRAGGTESSNDDLVIYRRHLRSGLKVVRATDPGLFQMWHPKECKRKGVSEETYKSCVRSRAMYEGSLGHLGLLIAFNNISTFQKPATT